MKFLLTPSFIDLHYEDCHMAPGETRDAAVERLKKIVSDTLPEYEVDGSEIHDAHGLVLTLHLKHKDARR